MGFAGFCSLVMGNNSCTEIPQTETEQIFSNFSALESNNSWVDTRGGHAPTRFIWRFLEASLKELVLRSHPTSVLNVSVRRCFETVVLGRDSQKSTLERHLFVLEDNGMQLEESNSLRVWLRSPG